METNEKDIPQFITIPKNKYRPGVISFSVNGQVRATMNDIGLARRVMNEVAVMLMEKYYPDYHFVITLSQGDDVLDTVIL